MAGTRNPWEENYGANDGQDTGAKPWEQAYQQPEAPKSRTWGEAIKDTGAQLAEGVNTTLGAIPSVVAPQSKAAGFFRDNAQYWRDEQSDVLKDRIAASDQRIQEAGKDGVLSQIGTAASEYWNDPAQAARLVATNLPSMAATLGTGAAAGLAAKGVAAARGLDAANKAALAAKYGTTTATATNAALNAGGARGEAFEDLQKAAIAQGMTPEQAEQAGVSGSIMPGVVGGVAGAISGKIGLEKAILGQATTGAAMRKAAGAFGAELAGEQTEELAPKVATNYQVGRIDPGRTLTDDLGRTMVETAIGSGPGAVVAGGASAMRTGETPPPPGAGEPTTSPGAADPDAPQTPPPNQPAPVSPPVAGPTLALAGPDRGVIQVAGDGTARTPAYQTPGYVGDVTDVEPRAVNPVREQVAAAAEQGGALSSAALTAIDTGLSDAMQPAPEQAPPQISLEEADARDQAAYEQFFASHDADPVVSRYFENDDDIPDFDAASNASEEDFLRALGATDEDIQDAIATTRQPSSPQGSAAGNAGPQAYEPAGPREGVGEGAASQTGQVNAGAIQQAAPDAPVPGVGGPAGADGAGSAATAVSGASGPGGAGTGAATGGGAGATEVGSARAGGRGDSNQALSAPTNLRDALVRVRQQKQEAANAQAAQAPAAAAAPVPGPAAAPAVEAAGVKPAGQRQLSADEQAAQDREEARAKELSLPPVLSARLQEAHKAHGRDVKRSVVERSIANEKANNTGTPKAKRERADRIARLEADLALFDEAAAMPPKEAAGPASIPATTGANSEPTSPQAIQAGTQPAQAGAAPAAAAGLTDGAPAQNNGAQAAPAAGQKTQAIDKAPGAAARALIHLAGLKGARLIADDGRGRKLIEVNVTPEFRRKHFVNGRMPMVDGLELKEKSVVTGNVHDNGYVLIDNREQLAARRGASLAPSTQGAAQAESAEQRTQRVAQAGEAWTRMPAAQREALAGIAAGLNPIQRKRVPSAAWADLNRTIQSNLADAMGGREEYGGNSTGTSVDAAPAAINSEAQNTGKDAVRIGRDQTPLSEGGKPFKTRKAAGDAKKLQPMMRVVTVPGGYALAEKTPAQLAAEERASRRLRNPSTSARGEPIPAHAFIAAAGGLNRVAASDMGVDGNPRIGNRTLFAGQGRGLSMDQATQMLIQDGYLSEGATINDALALIKKSLTQPQYNADGIERIAQAEADAQFEDYLAAQEEAAADGDTDPFGMADEFTAEELDEVGYTDADPALQAEVSALIAQAEAIGIDTYAILEDIARTYANATQDQYNAAARDALAQAIARGNQDGGSTAAQAAPAAEPAAEQELNRPSALTSKEQAATESVAQTVSTTVEMPPTRQQESSPFARFATGRYRIAIRDEGNGPYAEVVAIQRGSGVEVEMRMPGEALDHPAFSQLNARAQALFETPTASMFDAEPTALELASQTPTEAAAQQEAQEQAAKAEAARQRAADAQAARAEERKRIAQASVRAADSFELGQDPMDSLTGQGGLMFSRAAATEVRNLVTLHNLTDENLRYADSMGGLPVPSIGITKVESPFGGFGNITLIAPKGMIDPKAGVPVYDRDAWTARFPTMNFKKVKASKADALYERIKGVRDLVQDDDGFVSQLWEQIRNASVQTPDKVTSLFTRYAAPRALYAQQVLGKTVKVPTRAVTRTTYPIGHDKELIAYWKKNGARFNAVEHETSGAEFPKTPEAKGFDDAVKAAIARYADKTGIPEFEAEGIAQMMPDGGVGAGVRDRLIRDFDTFGKKEVDLAALVQAIDKLVKRDDAGYLRWVEGLVKPLFDEPTITLRGREVAPTLDNIVDAMTVGATAGAEKSMTFSPGKVAAMLGKQFKSLDEIKAARDQVVSAQAETEGKKATDALLTEYRTHVSQFYGGKDWRGNIDTWAANDDSMEALAKAGKLPPSDASIRATLARMNFKGVDQRAVDMAREAIAALRNAATDYFEAKPQRAVTLDEFKGAVVPKGTSAETIAILEKHGIAVEVHNKTEGAREKAIQKLAKRLDRQSGDVLLSFAGQQAATADQHALATAQQRLEVGEDAETVRQETGWFQGKDGKWRFEISDADAKLKDRAQWATQRDALQAKSEAALQSKWAAQEARNVWLRQRGESPSRISSESKKDAEFKALATALKKAETTLDKARQAQDVAGRDGAGITVGSLLDHPALFAAYPGIADVRVELRDGLPANNASYTYEGRSIDLSAHSTDAQLLSTLLHEIQHGIQHIEGFASGGPSGEMMWLGDMRPIAMAEYQKLIAEINRPMSLEEYARQAWGVDSVTDEIRQDYEQNFVPSHMAALQRKGLDGDLQRTAGWRAYRRLAGEVEARNTQARQGMTDEQRRATPPSQTADVADADVIVVFNGKEMANAPMPANAAPDAATTAQPLRTPAATIRAAITKAYGKLLGQLESKGLVTLTQTEDEAIEAAAQARAQKTGGDVEAIQRSMTNAMRGETDLDVKRSADGAIQGFFDPQTGQSFLIADNLTAEAAPGVLMHEVGIHMAADGSMKALFNRAAMMLKLQRGNPFMKAVQDRMDAAGETSGEEAAAYIAEAYENDRANAPASVQRWLADLLAAVKAWMFKKGIMGADRLTVADIAAVARANAKTLARGQQGVVVKRAMAAFSRAPQSRSAAIKEMLDAQAAWDKMEKGDAENITLEKFSEMTDRSMNARTALADELVSMPDDGFALQAKTPDGRMLILTPSAQKAGKWQLTRFGSDGTPWGDTNFDTKKQAALEFIDEADLKTIQGADNEGAAFSRTPGDQTQTEAFKRWFAGSKVVDAQTGKPLVVYHGTHSSFTEFKPNDALGGGMFFSPSPEEAGAFTGATGSNIMPVYLSAQKVWPKIVRSYDEVKAIRAAKSKGYDAIRVRDDQNGVVNWVVFDPTQVKSATGNNGNFDPANADIRFSRTTAQSIASSMGDMTPDQEKAYRNVAGVKAVPTVRERMDALKANLGLKLRQGLVDQFAAIKQLDQNAYVQARMSKGTDGTLEAILMYGKPFMRDGAPDVDVKDGGFAKVLASLKGEQDRWMMWIAAQRAEKLKAEGKENLMTDDDISALKTLNAGRMADGTARTLIYAKALQELNAYNDAMLKLAMESGLIDQAAYDLMAGQPYVPFYRLMEDGDMKGPKFSSGLTNQKAWQKLNGGSQQLNADLLQNMLLNWSHLLQASAKNRAATATMDAAEKMAVAYKVDADTKGSVKVMRDGSAEHWMVEDPYLLDAISAIHYVPSPLMKPLAKFKQLLTWGVTVNPTFKIRNLIRDSVSAIAQSELGYNPAGNVAKGWKLTAKDSQIYASMLASGGLIKFGTQENTDRLRAQVAKLGGVVLDKSGTERFFGQIKDLYDVYNEFGDRAENVNRAALYDALIKKGKTHAEAAFMARDLMDFSMSGSAPVVRFLTQAVPFLNARLVGLDKLGRAAMEDPRRFAAVTGAVALASLALMAGYSDDEDWKKREDWDRDAYWWFKIGGQAYRIPKPFEVGAIGTLAERTAELMFNDEMTGKRYMERVSHMLSGTFSFNPVPQAFKPLLDLYANKDSFTGRAIESQADQRLRPQDRYSERTPEVAKFLGGLGLPDPAQLVKGEYSAMSPKQVEHLIRGYFSWVGTAAMTVSDFGLRPLAGRGERPDMRLKDVFIAGNFVENLPTGSSRYVTQMYEQSRQVEQAYASYQEAIKAGDAEKAQSIKESAGPLLRNRPAYTAATRQLAEINRTAKRIEADQAMAGAAKRARLTELEQQRQVVAQRVSRLDTATP